MHLYLEVVLISCVFYGKTVRSGQLVNHDYLQSRALQEHIEGNVGSVQNSGMLTEYEIFKICIV